MACCWSACAFARNLENGGRPSEASRLRANQAGQLQHSGSRSDLASAAINEQFATRDETGIIRGQKQRRLGNFIGFSHTSHRDCGNYPCNRRCEYDGP
jgi:hypothetical protein